jgi:hypothetical protein
MIIKKVSQYIKGLKTRILILALNTWLGQFENEMTEDYDPMLSRKIDCLKFLLDE